MGCLSLWRKQLLHPAPCTLHPQGSGIIVERGRKECSAWMVADYKETVSSGLGRAAAKKKKKNQEDINLSRDGRRGMWVRVERGESER